MEEGREGKGQGERVAMTVRAERRVERESVRERARAKESEIDKRKRGKTQKEAGDKGRGQGTHSKSITLPVKLASFSKQNEYSPTVLAVKMKSPCEVASSSSRGLSCGSLYSRSGVDGKICTREGDGGRGKGSGGGGRG